MGLLSGIKRGLFGEKGGFETQKVPRWNEQQQELFKQLFEITSPQIGQDLEATTGEQEYEEFLKNYDSWSTEKINSLYNPEAVKEYYRTSVMPEFEQTQLPKIEATYGGAPGYWGSARTRAVSDAYSNLARQEASDIFDVEQQRTRALKDAMAGVPASLKEIATAQRSRSAENSPYLSMALELLGLQEFDTLAAYRQGTGGFMENFLGSMAKKLGEKTSEGLWNLIQWKAGGLGGK